MRSIKAKRIAAVAASLLVGLAFASQGVNFGTVPIINNQGQPVVQIVVGSQAKPSDGVVAANIAAVIGSLAHTTQNITAYVSGRSGISCVVTTPTCTLSNQQVYLGEKGLVVPAGSYSFSALIGSVLNPGVLSSGNLENTKSILSTSGSFDYPDSTTSPYPITSTPTATSVYTGISSGISPSTSVSATNNGGGVTFTRFTNNGFDNILQLTSSQVPGLLSSAGTYQESESLWLAGFPVYDQNTGQLSVLDTNGAYQITFGNPIQNTTSTGKISAQFSLLGENWTVYNMSIPAMTGVSSSNFIVGGSATFAQSSTPVETIYVGQNISTGPFKVVLSDLSYPNSNGLSDAALSIYKNGVLTNVTSAGPASNDNVVVNASGTKLYIDVSQTFPGLYAYQKWAKIQLFSNTFTVKSGQNFNSANGNNWLAALRWTTNQSNTADENSYNGALQGIILYSNQSNQQTLTPGSSMTYITNPAKWNVNFVGDSLGAPSSGNANYDALQLSTNNGGGSAWTYSNGQTGLVTPNVYSFNTLNVVTPGTPNSLKAINETTVTEPVNIFQVSSSIPTAFQINSASYAAPTSNLQTLDYNLNPYTFSASNAVDAAGIANLIAGPSGGLVFVLQNNGVNGNYVTSSNPLTVYVTGYRQVGSTSTTTYSVSFNGFNTQTLQGDYLTNATNIQLGMALPAPGANVLVYETANTLAPITTGSGGNDLLLGTLNPASTPTLLYKVPQYSYYIAPNVDTATYTGEQNNVNFALGVSTTPGNTVARGQYFNYTMPEITVGSSSTPNANIIVGLTNSSSVTSTAPLYWLNETNGNNNAVEYQSSQNVLTKAVQGFRTERGGEVGSIGTSSITYYEPKSVDGLEFLVGASNGNTINASTVKMYGPYTVGQATNIPNVTIGKVNATCSFSTTSCNVTGLKNLTAVPSAASAVVGSPLNTVTTPIAVLDSNANNSTNLIVIGSGYVNSVAQSIFNANPSLQSSFGPNSTIVQAYGNKILVAGYTAQQTVNAGNSFINQLLQDAASS
ncbi:MAG: S-layer protein [Candidatus Micrarchaeia archaeon]